MEKGFWVPFLFLARGSCLRGGCEPWEACNHRASTSRQCDDTSEDRVWLADLAGLAIVVNEKLATERKVGARKISLKCFFVFS